MKVDIYNVKNQYNVIYIDPPWKYNARNNKRTKFGGGAGGHYQTMSIDEIAKLPIGDIAADNCALFMWCTFPYLDKQIKLFEAWGFQYKTLGFSWVKTNKKNSKPFFGIGYYTKSNCEVCLLGIKGKMKPVKNTVSSCVISPKREHSRKPEQVRSSIVELFGDIPKIELFARESCNGWDCWGNETNKFKEEQQ